MIPNRLLVISLLLLLAGAGLSVVVGQEVIAWEASLLSNIRTHGRPELTRTMIAISFLGKQGLLVVWVIAGLYFHRTGRIWNFGWLSAAAILTTIIGLGVKYIVWRIRPSVVPYLLAPDTGPSYPSGHSILSCAFLLMLAWLLQEEKGSVSTAAHYLLISSAVVLALLVGLSRMYLGVHWPTDIVGAYALAGGSVGLLIYAKRRWFDPRATLNFRNEEAKNLPS